MVDFLATAMSEWLTDIVTFDNLIIIPLKMYTFVLNSLKMKYRKD